MDNMKNEMIKKIKQIGIDKEIYQNSIEYGETVANEILNWANKDGYSKRTSLPGYIVNQNPARWQPTPPDYAEAIEPHWNTIRPFVLDSASQFNTGLPVKFSIDEKSKFFEQSLEVYHTVNNIDDKELEIAKFWDCNPNISQTNGHVMFFRQQITPGGHWIHIAAQIVEKEKLNQIDAAATMAQVSIVLADAFISAWDQKYETNLIRPETFINKYIDPKWKPILQTPAFPEHTSGHSVASAAAATVLTYIFGDNYSFTDFTEIPFGLKKRSFNSFLEASQEAAISRLYGGIHYRPAIDLGYKQGMLVGQYVFSKIHLK